MIERQGHTAPTDSQTKKPLRLLKGQRLLKTRQYQTLYRSQQRGGTRLYSYHVVGATTPTGMQELGRLGITVSKKVSKLAVRRNRIKRQIREFYRLRQKEYKGADLVITAKPACGRATPLEREENLNELSDKIKAWRRWHCKRVAPRKSPQ